MEVPPPTAQRLSPFAARILPVTAIGGLVGLLFLGVAGAGAGPKERLERAEARVERLSGELTGSRERFDRLTRRADAARVAESRIEARLAGGERRLAQVESRLDEAESLAREAGRRLAAARQALAERLVSIYESGTSNALAVLLSTEDFGALASAGTYLQAIADSERDLARRVAELRRQRLSARARIDRAKVELATRIAGLRTARDSVVAARLRSEASAASLAALQGERRSRIEELRSEVERIESELAPAEGEPNFAGGPYAIPTYIVMCESGGNYSALNPSSGAGGAYQIIPSTWEAYGGQGLPHLAPKAEQDRIARLIWENDGPGAWVCA